MAVYEKIKEKNDLMSGTVIWAYAFHENSTKDGMRLNQKPVKGRLSVEKSPAYGDTFNPERTPYWFVPFMKNSETDYAWSKAVRVYARNYADTEEEARDAYNRLIDKNIEWYREKIANLEKMKA